MNINKKNESVLNEYEEKTVLFLLKSLTDNELKNLGLSPIKIMVLNKLYNELKEKEKIEKYIEALLKYKG